MAILKGFPPSNTICGGYYYRPQKPTVGQCKMTIKEIVPEEPRGMQNVWLQFRKDQFFWDTEKTDAQVS